MLEVKDLCVNFKAHNSSVQAVRGVSFSLNKGETLAIVGESGSGKSVTCQAIMGLLNGADVEISDNSVFFNGQKIDKSSYKKIRGNRIGMVFQDPMTALNPTLKIVDQLTEGAMYHLKLSKKEALQKAKKLLELVGIVNVDERLEQYPHQFSGGMRQRIVIAMALMCNPDILIADEPTTALDATIQIQILSLFKKIQNELGIGIIIVTHDFGVVAAIADRVLVMYQGQCIESGFCKDVLQNPQHTYTKQLLGSMLDRNF